MYKFVQVVEGGVNAFFRTLDYTIVQSNVFILVFIITDITLTGHTITDLLLILWQNAR